MWAEWLEAAIGRPRPGQRLLVLCRTRATLSSVRRLAARRGGWLGVEAATPAGLAQQVRQRPLLSPAGARSLDPERPIPPGSAMGGRIGDRPGLAEVARRWVQQVRQARAVGDDPAVPAWLEELLASEFAQDDDLAALLELCAAAAARGKRLHAGATWDRVVALGFDDEPEAMSPTDRHLAAALAGHVARPVAPREGPLDACEVPDVGAEAATAAWLASADPEGTLILVADDASARRVRDALVRNDVACAWRGTEALSAHPLAAAVRRATAWFAEGTNPALQAADLEHVLSRTSLGRTLHPAAEAVLARRLAAFDEADRRFSRRRMIEVLEAARLLDAPLDRWITRMAEIDAGRFWPPKDRIRAASHHVLVRLALLRAALSSRPVDEVLAELEPEPPTWDQDDFDDVLAEILGADLPEPELPAQRTLGAVKRFLVDCRVRVHDDDLAKAILAALHRRRHLQATLPRVHEALAGPGIDRGILYEGVDVVALDDWDGRPCRQLVVLDVHDHGLARRPAPDPLLQDDEIRRLGALTGNDRVHHRLRTLRRASARAERTLLLVTRRDASGREVVPPIQLDMRWVDPPTHAGSYGLGAPLPENARVAALAVAVGPPTPPSHVDPAVRFLATQATLEWARDGAVGSAATLDAASWLLPWLGHAEGVPEAGLPDAVHSVSSLLQPLARCPWQAFGKVVLGVREPPDVSSDLDPRELGNAVHLALERAGDAIGFALGARDPQAVVALLQDRTAEAFDLVLDRFGALSEARRASALGRRERWARHWESWVASRARWPILEWPGALYHHPDVTRAEALLRRSVPACADGHTRDLREWILANARPGGSGGASGEVLLTYRDRALPASAAPDLPGLLDDAALRAVGTALDGARYHADTLSGRNGKVSTRAVAAEVPFGDPEQAPAVVHGLEGVTLALPETVLRLGSRDLRLRGLIDRIEWYEADGTRLALVVDWKTGASPVDGQRFRQDQYQLRDPQLLVYAMVLERASREGLLPPELVARTAAVAHDRVLHTFKDREVGRPQPERPDTWLPIEPRTLRAAAQELGVRVDAARAGRWELRPAAQTCPRISAWGGFCDLADGCRLRRLPPEASP